MTDADNSLSNLLSADRPIDTLDDDRLHRRDFARNIARIFREWKGRDSLVIALYGNWGTGKTSLKNLILRCMPTAPNYPDTNTEVLQFNPWQWVGHTELTTAFFAEVSKALGRSTDDIRATRAARILRAYASFLAANRAVLEGLPKIIVYAAMLIGAMGFGASVSQGLSDTGPILSALLFAALTIAGILGLSETILEKAAAWISATNELGGFRHDIVN